MRIPTHSAASDTPQVDPLIGGTLALLTLYARAPDMAAADRIAANLAQLARHPRLSEPLRTLCTQLFLHWLGPVAMQDCAAHEQWKDVCDAPAALQ
jgi:hypothetical protein